MVETLLMVVFRPHIHKRRRAKVGWIWSMLDPAYKSRNCRSRHDIYRPPNEVPVAQEKGRGTIVR